MIHTSSIRTIFDNQHIDTLHFGGFIKTYVIPCKYDERDPYVSATGEYFILFFIPPTQQLLHQINSRDITPIITNFMNKFDATWTTSETEGTFALFKMTISGELAYVGNIITTFSYGQYASLTLSLFSSDQLKLDQQNNVIGIKQPKYPDAIIKFDEVDFEIDFSNDEYRRISEINKISPYYSLGGLYLEIDNVNPKKIIEYTTSGKYHNIYEWDEPARGLPIYYTNDNIVFDIKKVYTHSLFHVMLPNPNNYKQLLIIHNIGNSIILDFYDGNNEIITKTITHIVKTVEWIKDNTFQIVKLTGENVIYECQFDQESLEFINLTVKETNVVLRSKDLSNFTYGGVTFTENKYNTHLVYNQIDLEPMEYDSRQISMDNRMIDIFRLREVPGFNGIITKNNTTYLNFYNITRFYNNVSLSAEIYNWFNIKNITPAYFEMGNWTILPNCNVLLPNVEDILKSTIIKTSNDQKTTYISTVDNNINLVEIRDDNNMITKIEGNIIKINDIDTTSTLYSFRNLFIVNHNIDSTSNFEIIHMGIINNFIDLNLLSTNVSTNKKFMNRFPNYDYDNYGNFYKLKFYIKYNDMIDFINADKFIKLTNADTFNISIAGKPIIDMAAFINSPYDTLVELTQSNNFDFNMLTNDNNTFHQNIITCQNSIPKTLFGVVVDGEEEFTLCQFPYQKLKYYEYLKPVINGEFASYTIDHFIDNDGTIYSKAAIDFITLNINVDILDITLSIIAENTINVSTYQNTWTTIPYSIDTFINVLPFYKPDTNYIDLSGNTMSDILNVIPTEDSTIVSIIGTDNVDHTFEIDLSNLTIEPNEEIEINLTCDSTGNIENEIGLTNIFDNVLYNDGISITFNCMGHFYSIYYDLISKDIDIFKDKTNLIKDFDIQQYGQFTNKCIAFIILNNVPEIDCFNLNSNSINVNADGLISKTQYWDRHEQVWFSDEVNVINPINIIPHLYTGALCVLPEEIDALPYTFQSTHDNNIPRQIFESDAITQLSTTDFDYKLYELQSGHWHNYNSINFNYPHQLAPLLQLSYDAIFGILRVGATMGTIDVNEVNDQYLGSGANFYTQKTSKFYGIKISDLPIMYSEMRNTNPHDVCLVLNNAKKNTPELMKFTLDNTSYDHLITEISFDTTTDISYEPTMDVEKGHGPLAALNSNYVIHFNYELTPAELSYINSDSKYDLARIISENQRKASHNSIIVSSKLKRSLTSVSRNNLNITIKNINDGIWVYVNGHLYSNLDHNGIFNLGKLRLFGNRQFGDKTIKILKNDNVIFEYNQTYC